MMKMLLILLQICTFSQDATCDDGEQNQDETGLDCGGQCNACASCDDGIQNQEETGVDCGGPCPKCSNEIIPFLKK